GRYIRGISNFWRGEFAAARDLFEQCHGLREPVHRQASSALAAEDLYSMMLGYSAMTLAYLGHFDQARSRANDALVEARGLRHAYTVAICLVCMCLVAALANLPHEVRRYAEELFDLAN